MMNDPAVFSLRSQFEVQHLVVKNVVHDKERDSRAIQRFAQDDGIVHGVVVAKDAERKRAAPRKPGPWQRSAKVPLVDGAKFFDEVIRFSNSGRKHFASARLPGIFVRFDDARSLAILDEDLVCLLRHTPFENLAEENEGERAVHVWGGVAEDVGNPHEKLFPPAADRGIDAHIVVIPDFDFRKRGLVIKLLQHLGVDFGQRGFGELCLCPVVEGEARLRWFGRSIQQDPIIRGEQSLTGLTGLTGLKRKS